MIQAEERLRQLLGRDPTDAERQRIMRAGKSLGIGDNDALWELMVILELHRTYHERIPGELDAVLTKAFTEANITADKTMAASVEKTKADLRKIVVDVAREAATVTSREKILKTGMALTTVILLGMAVSASAGWAWGKHSPYGGSVSATDEALKAWALSPTGRRAYHLSTLTSLSKLTDCSAPGWQRKARYERTAPDGSGYGNGVVYCFPHESAGDVHGWVIEKLPPRPSPLKPPATVF
jgi:hypothetical protein